MYEDLPLGRSKWEKWQTTHKMNPAGPGPEWLLRETRQTNKQTVKNDCNPCRQSWKEGSGSPVDNKYAWVRHIALLFQSKQYPTISCQRKHCKKHEVQFNQKASQCCNMWIGAQAVAIGSHPPHCTQCPRLDKWLESKTWETRWKETGPFSLRKTCWGLLQR